MKKDLLETIFASEKRKNVLLMLLEGPAEMETFLRSIKTTRQALLPQIRVLEESNLVRQKKDIYELTTIGKLIAEEMKPLIGTLGVFDSSMDYWGEREMGFIPPHLLLRLREIGPCTVVSNIPPAESYSPSKQAVESGKRSKSQISVTTFLFPNFPSILADFKQQGVKMCLVVSPELLEKMRQTRDDKYRGLLNSDTVDIFVYRGRMDFMAFGYNDFSFMMRMFTKTGEPDQKYVISSSPSALEWGKELFNHYLKDAVPVTEI
ncbi:helix-turn-helix transcriptional regulator [Methanolobus chelungpuianus]|uniref:Methanogenesis regulatory protein FilR1 middle domain-containing protein n=1 Tax=Methanolobus chelungpuianus TaxID=502115 RepID=A0AAE3HBG3_9EURY|nr:winged helix-turn-helix domain-containing protein [Methanolobus chelungpuianus]MCQ6963029.1 hypothetical protein [Methanolobus chelungpuianus]